MLRSSSAPPLVHLYDSPAHPPLAPQGGVVAAFGLVRGVAQGTDALLAPAPGEAAATLGSGLTALPHAALLAGESMLTFAFASVAVELAFRQGFVKPLARGGSGSSGGGGSASSSS